MSQYWPPQPQAYGPPPGPPAKPPKLTWRDRKFWTHGPGVIVTVVVVGLVLSGLLYLVGQSPRGEVGGSPFTVTVTGCDATTGSLATATISFTITNNATITRSARVDVEYRDGGGSRLDTDTAYVRDIAPSDTVRHDESTILDAAPTGVISCSITGVR